MGQEKYLPSVIEAPFGGSFGLRKSFFGADLAPWQGRKVLEETSSGQWRASNQLLGAEAPGGSRASP